MSEFGSWPSIAQHGLFNTSALVGLFGVTGAERDQKPRNDAGASTLIGRATMESPFAEEMKKATWGITFRAPEGEQDLVFAIRMSLLKLADLYDDYRAALSLWNYTNGLAVVSPPVLDQLRWQQMAIREGAMILDQYSKALKIPLRNKPWLSSVKRELISTSRKQFDKAFPMIDEVRHSILHRAEMLATPGKLTKNAATNARSLKTGFFVDPSGNTVGIPDTYIGNSYCATFNGNLVGYSLTRESAEVLQQTTRLILDAFI